MNERFKFKAVVKGRSIESEYRIVLSNVSVFVTGHIGIGLEGLEEQIKEQYPNISIKELDGLLYYFFKKRPFGSEDHLPITPEVILQCTGLVDKTNSLVYEGDIVKLTNSKDNTEEIRLVTFKDCAFQFNLPNSMQIDRPLYCWAINYPNHYKHIEIEVIGNIYQHPEKLEFNTHLKEGKDDR